MAELSRGQLVPILTGGYYDHPYRAAVAGLDPGRAQAVTEDRATVELAAAAVVEVVVVVGAACVVAPRRAGAAREWRCCGHCGSSHSREFAPITLGFMPPSERDPYSATAGLLSKYLK